MNRIVVLTGAGMSAESGLKTFRDEDGLWEGHDVMEVASLVGWHQNKSLVLEFYNQRRRQLFDVSPNEAHLAVARLAEYYDVTVVTQNVDDLHERAGSKQVIHLHGELLKVRGTAPGSPSIYWDKDLSVGDYCDHGSQLRPDIVWFGEEVPNLSLGIEAISMADQVIIIGTSMQVYPAASLISFAPPRIPVYYIDPRPHVSPELILRRNLQVIEKKAVSGVGELVEELVQKITT